MDAEPTGGSALGLNLSSEERRRAARHYGFMNGVFRIGEQVKQSIPTAIDSNILIQIVDRTDGDQDMMYSTGRSSDERWLRSLIHEVPLASVAGRNWVVQAMPGETFVITISAGVCSLVPTIKMSPASLIQKADNAGPDHGNENNKAKHGRVGGVGKQSVGSVDNSHW